MAKSLCNITNIMARGVHAYENMFEKPSRRAVGEHAPLGVDAWRVVVPRATARAATQTHREGVVFTGPQSKIP